MSHDLIEAEDTGHNAVGRAILAETQSSRAVQEVQAAMIIAKKFPRDENAAVVRIRKSCQRKRLAEVAVYSYPRGSTTVEGPSIRLAEAMAQCWGNLDFGIVELEQRHGESTCMAYCHDLETNTKQTKIFQVKHVRDTKRGPQALKESRDIYELVSNQGARRVRACILGVIPGDVIDEALDEINKTLKTSGGDKPLAERVRAMLMAFDGQGVTSAMIEKRLQHKTASITEHELVGLRKIYTSLKDGASVREDWFEFDDPGQASGSRTSQVADSLPKDVIEPEPEAPKTSKSKKTPPPDVGPKLVEWSKAIHLAADAAKLEELENSLKAMAHISEVDFSDGMELLVWKRNQLGV